MGGWNGNGKGFPHIVNSVMLRDPKFSLKKRRTYAAKIVQKLVHDRLLRCIVEDKAANVIQRCCHRHHEWLVTEKWHVMIQMEKTARKTKDKLASDMAKKRELHKRTTITNMKKKHGTPGHSGGMLGSKRSKRDGQTLEQVGPRSHSRSTLHTGLPST
eukprot:FR738069.1.p1 GENE.FR738069.1~~FR738069.1.p1  ORF type:complete len:169 (+),score=12.12 FR738069.1:34-507(+)